MDYKQEKLKKLFQVLGNLDFNLENTKLNEWTANYKD